MGGEQVEVDILAGAEQAVVIIVSVENNKARRPDEICNNVNVTFCNTQLSVKLTQGKPDNHVGRLGLLRSVQLPFVAKNKLL